MLSSRAPGRRWINGPGRATPRIRVILEWEPRSFRTTTGGIDVTDGWNARPAPRPPAFGQPPSAWWPDALADPWRAPYAPAAVVVPPAAPNPGPEPEGVPAPDAPRAHSPRSCSSAW